MASHRQASGSHIRNASNYVDLSEELAWVPTLSYGQPQGHRDPRVMLFPALVGAAHCGLRPEPGETIGPVG